MKDYFTELPKSERLPLMLRTLFERYGYRKYRMDAFEPYDIYRENKNFLTGDGILTFTDAGGRLMALKPDVTISIIKNCDENTQSQKLFYTENVFRPDKNSGRFCEISQTGLEYIGADTGYCEAEVVALACESLALIGGEYILSIGHMGLLTAVLQRVGLCGQEVIEAISGKNGAALAELAEHAGLDGESRELLLAAAAFSKPICEAEKLRRFAVSPAAEAACDELCGLAKTLAAFGQADKVMIDLSVTDDTDYYNGIVLRGYCRRSSAAVLAGGRYDNMCRRFNKPQPALGFALYLGELERGFYEPAEFDTDTLLICGDCPPPVIAAAVKTLSEEGAVRAEKSDDGSIRARRRLTLDGEGKISEVKENA